VADETKRINALLITEKGNLKVEEVVTREFSLTIVLNHHEIVTLLCTPKDLKWLAAGYLASEGLIQDKTQIKKITLNESKGMVHVETKGRKMADAEPLTKKLIASSGGRGVTALRLSDALPQMKITSGMKMAPSDIFNMVKDFQERSDVFKATGGVHSAALCDTNSILLFTEDIGRHNTIDKIFGSCLLEDISLNERGIITSGRVSSEILLKVAKRNIPILISKSAPTDVAVKLAERWGITLIGFVRGTKMNVYTNSQRVTDTPTSG
jgi:FdhD protein